MSVQVPPRHGRQVAGDRAELVRGISTTGARRHLSGKPVGASHQDDSCRSSRVTRGFDRRDLLCARTGDPGPPEADDAAVRAALARIEFEERWGDAGQRWYRRERPALTFPAAPSSRCPSTPATGARLASSSTAGRSLSSAAEPERPAGRCARSDVVTVDLHQSETLPADRVGRRRWTIHQARSRRVTATPGSTRPWGVAGTDSRIGFSLLTHRLLDEPAFAAQQRVIAVPARLHLGRRDGAPRRNAEHPCPPPDLGMKPGERGADVA